MPTQPPADSPFAVLGIAPRFDVPDAEIAARRAERLAGQGADAARVEAAARTLADPERRAEHLLALIGGPAVADIPHLPTIVQERLADLRARLGDPALAEAARRDVADERGRRLDRVARLFAALSGGDNPVVQKQRRRDVATELLALRELRAMASPFGRGRP